MTPLQKACKIRNWHLLRLKGAAHALLYLISFIPDEQVRKSARGRVKAIEHEVEESIKASYEDYKHEYELQRSH